MWWNGEQSALNPGHCLLNWVFFLPSILHFQLEFTHGPKPASEGKVTDVKTTTQLAYQSHIRTDAYLTLRNALWENREVTAWSIIIVINWGMWHFRTEKMLNFTKNLCEKIAKKIYCVCLLLEFGWMHACMYTPSSAGTGWGYPAASETASSYFLCLTELSERIGTSPDFQEHRACIPPSESGRMRPGRCVHL